VGLIGERGNPLALLHCILNYPTADQQANLGMILSLRNNFPDLVIGYSDHTLPGTMKNLEIAVLLGAKIIEKHFTHDKNLPGNDHYHSMDIHDLKRFRQNLEQLFCVIGSLNKYALPEEEISRQNARRSLVASKKINQGEIISADCLTWKRPAFGISPKDIEQVIGKRAVRNIGEDEIITKGHFD